MTANISDINKNAPEIKPAKYMIHVLGERIRRNRSYGDNYPVIVIRRSDWSTRVIVCDDVVIQGASRVMYRPNNPARALDDRSNIAVWVETDSPILFKKGDELIPLNDTTWRDHCEQVFAGC